MNCQALWLSSCAVASAPPTIYTAAATSAGRNVAEAATEYTPNTAASAIHNPLVRQNAENTVTVASVTNAAANGARRRQASATVAVSAAPKRTRGGASSGPSESEISAAASTISAAASVASAVYGRRPRTSVHVRAHRIDAP